jgi:DNA-binding CsgD family transcriptional regulator
MAKVHKITDPELDRAAPYIPPIHIPIDHRDPELKKVEKLFGLSHDEVRVIHARLALANATQAEIAEQLGISAQTVGDTLRREHVKEALAHYHSTALEKLTNLSSVAVSTLAELLQSPNERTRLQAAKVVLDKMPLEGAAGAGDDYNDSAIMMQKMLQSTLGQSLPNLPSAIPDEDDDAETGE